MKSSLYHVSSRETGKMLWQILTYDENVPCHMCGLPVESASVGGTAICGACDCGSIRKGARKTKWSQGKHADYPGNFSNVADHWEFETRSEAEEKMFALHLTGIEGWPHVIRKFRENATAPNPKSEPEKP
jgi:hypothetical protein